MSLPILPLAQLELLFLIFIRTAAIFFMMPLMGDRAVPVSIKAGFALLLTLILFPLLVGTKTPALSENLLVFCFRIASEIMIGVLIGLTGRFLLSGIQLCGQLIGFQMGFAIANVVDPVTSAQISLIAELYYLIVMLFFLAFDFHHLFILAIAESYQIVPPTGFQFRGETVAAMLAFSSDLFVVALQISAPVIAALTFVNIGMGIVARTVPQINIFIVGFPLQIATGLLFIGLSATVLSAEMGRILPRLERQLDTILRLVSP